MDDLKRKIAQLEMPVIQPEDRHHPDEQELALVRSIGMGAAKIAALQGIRMDAFKKHMNDAFDQQASIIETWLASKKDN